jgi:hypothetical protein
MANRVDGVFVPIQRESPAGRQHLHTLTAGAWLPFLQSSLTGVITSTVVVVIAYALRARFPWSWGGALGVIAWALTWYQLQKHWFSLTALEQVTGLDINRDGVIGDPDQVPESRIIHVRMDETTKAGHFHQVRFDLPASSTQMQELAIGVLQEGRPFTHREWTGAGAPFSDAEFRALRNEMIRRELMAPASGKDARQGYVMTDAGRQVLESFLPDAPSPTQETA